MKRVMSWMMIFAAVWLLAGGVANAADASASAKAAANAAADWKWIASDDKYGKYYVPQNVQIVSSVNGVATRLSAWTKTTYTYAGAMETIANYEIQAVLPDPSQLAYSLALVEISPQLRTIEYAQENFYNAQGKVIWSKIYDPRKPKEINSQSFDEPFYDAIVDAVFHYGEATQAAAPTRWISLWQVKGKDGSGSSSIADMTTMRHRGDNLIYWEWVEEKNPQGQVQEIKFMKKAVNLEQATQKIIECKYWSGAAGWQDLAAELDGRYTPIKLDSYEGAGYKRLKAYDAGYQHWVNRYRTDLPAETAAAK